MWPLTPWLPWQSRQPGALGSPLALSWPWMLLPYWPTVSAWHAAQSTLRVIEAHGRVREGRTSLWHWLHARLACTDCASSVASTYIERPSAALRSGLAWQERQSLSAIPCS